MLTNLRIVANRIRKLNEYIIRQIQQYEPEIDNKTLGFCLNEMRLDLIRVEGCIKTAVKGAWRTRIRPAELPTEIENFRMTRFLRVAKLDRIMCYDIEMSYVPFSKIEQSVTLISAIIHDGGTHCIPYKSCIFFITPPTRNHLTLGREIDRERIRKICEDHMKKSLNMNTSETFEIRIFRTERELL